jgi:kynurenine formamidase
MSLADRTAPTNDEFEAFKERFSNWGRWGDDDELGTLNHITSDVRKAAASLVQEGRSVSCASPLATTPGPRNPNPAQHFMRIGAWGSMDYIGVSYHGYANTHIDALCHIFTADGKMYGGRSSQEVTSNGARSASVDHWREGIVTRGVLYDIPRLRGTDFIALDEPVHGWDLEDAAKAQGLEPQPGDAVFIRTGRDPYLEANPDSGNAVPGEPLPAPGTHASALEFLYEHDASLLGWDFLEAADQGYSSGVGGPIHQVAIPYMGMPLLDNANFEDLGRTCDELGRWEFQLVIAPLIVIGGTGSPVNPVAVF